jgi:predicted nucleotidyltransferase
MTDPRSLAQDLLRELRRVLGERLHAVSLFGSAARGEWVEGLSDVNVLVLVDRIDVSLLAEAGPAAQKALADGVRPLLMEEAEWRRAWDAFAIEVADMKDASVVLHGDDPAAPATIEPLSLRLQAERELRAKLVQLHAGMLMSAKEPARLGELLVRALPSFTAYLRAALRLTDETVPSSSAEVIAEGCRVAGAEPSGLLTVLGSRRPGAGLELSLEDPVVDHFNTAAARLAAFTDSLGGHP